jgi:hypothetical protein
MRIGAVLPRMTGAVEPGRAANAFFRAFGLLGADWLRQEVFRLLQRERVYPDLHAQVGDELRARTAEQGHFPSSPPRRFGASSR